MQAGVVAFALIAASGATSALRAQSQHRPEILIVGSFHMANRNHDLYDVQADDVRSPQRQREIAEVIEVLKRFHPTTVAIEADIEDDRRIAREYAEYLAGRYQLSADETNQLGYRTARELGLRSVHAVNAWAGNDFPLQPVSDYAKAHGKEAQLQPILAQWSAATKELDAYLKAHTVLETLAHANSAAFIAENMDPYFALARLGEPGDYAGADLLGNYYLRNIRIYRNIVSLIGSEADRILVIYGYGHVGWLQEIARQDPAIRLRTLSEFTPAG
ncbi:MAG TPA: DUF5694 domain-containing protein [Gemmatimonadaceae bacterium]|nr:DUF5694 domain-containing protein [Gemmatimonadaceae bacterium]